VTAPIRIDLRDASSFPSRRVEEWRWSDLRRYLREAPEPSPLIAAEPGGPFADLGGREVLFANGQLLSGEAAIVAARDETVRLRFVSRATRTGHQAEAEVRVPAGASLLLLESYEGQGSAYAANAALRITVEPGARLIRVVLVDEAPDAISISRADVTLGEAASLSQTVLTTGAKLQRHETHVAHPGEGAAVRMDGLYVLDGDRQCDLTTVVEHTGQDGVTQQLTKGVVADEARGVFQGKIVVARGADGTDARMGHHALIASERAEVDAKPELEIYADDVSCAHGNTVGTLDEEALFYIRARGVPEPEARALMTAAFLGEVVDRIEPAAAQEIARRWLAVRFGGDQ
jgi:Fe-S cluster assembly protein SufD